MAFRKHGVAWLAALALTAAFAASTRGAALQITFGPEVDFPFPITYFTISDGGFGDLDGSVNGEILFDLSDPSTASLYTGAPFSSLEALEGRLTTSPTTLSFASLFDPSFSPLLGLSDFEMTALPGETAVLTMRFTADFEVATWSGGAVEGRFAEPIAGSSVHFVGGPTLALDLLWDGTLAGMPIAIVKGPGDPPDFFGSHVATLPPITGVVDMTGVLQVALGAGDSVFFVPEPATLLLLGVGFAALRLRRRP